MADNALIFTRCITCGQAVSTITTPTKRLVHTETGDHEWVDWNPSAEAPAPVSSQAGLASIRAGQRPSHRDVSIWADVRAVIDHVNSAAFLLGFLPEKPRELDFEAVRFQLDDARARLGELANALADGAGS